MTLIQDLLTENRYWTFWTSDWSKKVNVLWGGKTPFKNVITGARRALKKTRGQEILYERQVQLKQPDISFEQLSGLSIKL